MRYLIIFCLCYCTHAQPVFPCGNATNMPDPNNCKGSTILPGSTTPTKKQCCTWKWQTYIPREDPYYGCDLQDCDTCGWPGQTWTWNVHCIPTLGEDPYQRCACARPPPTTTTTTPQAASLSYTPTPTVLKTNTLHSKTVACIVLGSIALLLL